jgi:hypothetical protein
VGVAAARSRGFAVANTLSPLERVARIGLIDLKESCRPAAFVAVPRWSNPGSPVADRRTAHDRRTPDIDVDRSAAPEHA